MHSMKCVFFVKYTVDHVYTIVLCTCFSDICHNLLSTDYRSLMIQGMLMMQYTSLMAGNSLEKGSPLFSSLVQYTCIPPFFVVDLCWLLLFH